MCVGVHDQIETLPLCDTNTRPYALFIYLVISLKRCTRQTSISTIKSSNPNRKPIKNGVIASSSAI